jgi:hypothetical protein
MAAPFSDSSDAERLTKNRRIRAIDALNSPGDQDRVSREASEGHLVASLLGLQRLAGNTAVTALIRRQALPGAVAVQRQEEEAPEEDEEDPFESPEAREARKEGEKFDELNRPPGTRPYEIPEDDTTEGPAVWPAYEPEPAEPEPEPVPVPEEAGPDTGAQGAGPGHDVPPDEGTPDNDDGSHDFSPAVGPLAEPERASGEGEQNQDDVENQEEEHEEAAEEEEDEDEDEEEEEEEEEEEDPDHISTVDPDKTGKSKQATKTALKPHNLPRSGEEDDTDRPDTGVPGQRRDKSRAPQDPWDREDDIRNAGRRRVRGGRRRLRDND